MATVTTNIIARNRSAHVHEKVFDITIIPPALTKLRYGGAVDGGPRSPVTGRLQTGPARSTGAQPGQHYHGQQQQPHDSPKATTHGQSSRGLPYQSIGRWLPVGLNQCERSKRRCQAVFCPSGRLANRRKQRPLSLVPTHRRWNACSSSTNTAKIVTDCKIVNRIPLVSHIRFCTTLRLPRTSSCREDIDCNSMS